VIYCFQFCLNFAFKFNLRRYNMVVADAAIMKTQIAELRMNEAGAYPRPLLSST